MRYKINHQEFMGEVQRNIVIDRGNEEFTSFPVKIGNPNYDSFLESQPLTDIEIQSMEPEIWHSIVLNEGGV